MTNKTIIITGANGGLGKALLKECSKSRMNIIAHSRAENKEFNDFVDKLTNTYKNYIQKIYFDLSDESSIQEKIKKVLEEHDSIDALVNNASTMKLGGLFTTKISDIKEVFQVNLFSQILITQLVMKKMIKQKNGSIINIASTHGNKVVDGNISYNLSKSALIAFTSNLAIELGAFNIKVNSIAPGVMDTKMIANVQTKYKNEKINRTCLKKIISTKEIAKMVLFLIENNEINISGQTINIDSGYF